MIKYNESGKYTEVLTERLEEVVQGDSGCPRIHHGGKCPHDIMNQEDDDAICLACWLTYLTGELE